MDRSARLLKPLERLVREEYATQREHIESQWSLPLAQRVRTGKAIEGLCLSGSGDRTGRLAFTCQTNDSRFREGDYFYKSHPLLEFVAECVLELDEETHLEAVYLPGGCKTSSASSIDILLMLNILWLNLGYVANRASGLLQAPGECLAYRLLGLHRVLRCLPPRNRLVVKSWRQSSTVHT